MNRKIRMFTTAALAAVLLAGCEPAKEAPQSTNDIAQSDTVESERDTEKTQSDGTTDDTVSNFKGAMEPQSTPEDEVVEMGEVPFPETDDGLVTVDDIKN